MNNTPEEIEDLLKTILLDFFYAESDKEEEEE